MSSDQPLSVRVTHARDQVYQLARQADHEGAVNAAVVIHAAAGLLDGLSNALWAAENT